MTAEEPFPGTKKYEGWLFLYLEADGTDEFSKLFDEVGDYIESRVKPFPNGSFGTTNSILELPDGGLMFGISINGDIGVFEDQIRSFADSRALRVAVIEYPLVILEGGDKIAFEDCARSYFDL